MKCPVCKHPLMRVSSRTVVLGNRGHGYSHTRRVPIYARCPRLMDPAFHKARLTKSPALAPRVTQEYAPSQEAVESGLRKLIEGVR